MALHDWLPWIGTWIGIIIGGGVAVGTYAFGGKRGWWW